MLLLRLDVDDLASVRFACSPLTETVLSLWAWQNPVRHAEHQPLLRRSAPLLRQLDWPLLRALVGPGRRIPDFLTPHPAAPVPGIADEFTALRATPAERMAAELADAAGVLGPHPLLRSGHADPAALLPRIADALAEVNDALTRVPAAALLHWSADRGLHRAAAHPTTQIVEHALAALAADAADLLTGPDADRLTACGSAPCNRYLLRHGRRHWCSTRCGDRARAARAYARRTGRPEED
ncbi:CGNR zinc finger domain-containing protein [Streptomyces sp. NPDC001118]